jgi:hypothetical protein
VVEEAGVPDVTIRIRDEDLVRKARALAARRGLSLSALVRVHLEELVERDDEYESARRRALGLLRRGLDLDGPLPREELYGDDRS